MVKKIFILTFLLLAMAAYAHDPEFRADDPDYRTGYIDGYNHGFQDQQARVKFEFTHAAEYQGGHSYNENANCEYRVGYAEGYADGYFSRSQRFPIDSRAVTTQPVTGVTGGEATVFKDTGFEGISRIFPIGRYPELEDGWDDEIESILTSGNVRVILFDRKNFQGERLEVERDQPDLGHFNGKAASMIIEPIR